MEVKNKDCFIGYREHILFRMEGKNTDSNALLIKLIQY